jgi:acetylornithine deacetylase/succinyl-diaminopimelate desuccinylase-like protein
MSNPLALFFFVTLIRTILMYGHLDKQPPLTEEWETGLHPYDPVVRDGKIYGRGSSDDGYAIFSAITAVKALQTQGTKNTNRR